MDNHHNTKQQLCAEYRIHFQEKVKWKNYLQHYGFVVIKQWIGSQQCQQYLNEAWTILQILSNHKLNRNDRATQADHQNYPCFGLGMIPYVCHTRFQWELRKKCKPIFSQLWQTNNLKSSFDGFCFMNGLQRYQQYPFNVGLHTDQAPSKNYLYNYQGMLTLTNNKHQNDGGYVIVPSSNHYHHQYFKQKGLSDVTSDYYLVPKEDRQKPRLKKFIKVNNLAGDFILFDSRSFHCNTPPINEVLRVVCYIYMTPSINFSSQLLEERKKLFKDKLSTNCYPQELLKQFQDKYQMNDLIMYISQNIEDEEITKLI